MKIFDLHCDTLYELYKRKLPFDNAELHITADRTAGFSDYTQVLAIWSEQKLSEEECFAQFKRILAYKDTLRFPENFHPILAVEGGKLLAGKLDRVKTLADAGVRYLTPVWADECCMGGAWNTEAGLTGFGFSAVRECLERGIFPDLSHTSGRMADEILELCGECGKPTLATHSNSFAVYPHPRNLTDERFGKLLKLGGIVGISLCPYHLCDEKGGCGVDRVLTHIEHYLSLGGEKAVCLGCDFDGIERTPAGLSSCAELPRLAESMSRIGYSDPLIEAILYENAASFFERNGVPAIS